MATDGQSRPMMTLKQVAQLLGIHVNTLRRWSNQGIVKTQRFGARGDRRFLPEDITQFLYEFSKSNGDKTTK